jgi:uncharacterized damage-inducible protein DinB
MDVLIRNLSAAQWTQELGGYFKTIMQLCGHLSMLDMMKVNNDFSGLLQLV